jgi:hypothetical protein
MGIMRFLTSHRSPYTYTQNLGALSFLPVGSLFLLGDYYPFESLFEGHALLQPVHSLVHMQLFSPRFP